MLLPFKIIIYYFIFIFSSVFINIRIIVIIVECYKNICTEKYVSNNNV